MGSTIERMTLIKIGWLSNARHSYRDVLFLLQSHLLLPESIAELADPLVHGGRLHVALVQVLALLLQFGVLVLVELVPQLANTKEFRLTEVQMRWPENVFFFSLPLSPISKCKWK